MAAGPVFTSLGVPVPAIPLQLAWISDRPSEVRVLNPVCWPGTTSGRVGASKEGHGDRFSQIPN